MEGKINVEEVICANILDEMISRVEDESNELCPNVGKTASSFDDLVDINDNYECDSDDSCYLATCSTNQSLGNSNSGYLSGQALSILSLVMNELEYQNFVIFDLRQQLSCLRNESLSGSPTDKEVDSLKNS